MELTLQNYAVSLEKRPDLSGRMCRKYGLFQKKISSFSKKIKTFSKNELIFFLSGGRNKPVETGFDAPSVRLKRIYFID